MQVDQSPSWGMATGVNIAVAGGSRFGVSYMLDGATNTNRFDQTGLNMTAVATTPQFEGPAMRALASNWRVSGIYRFASGAPHSVVAGSDRALTGLANQVADQVSDDIYQDTSGVLGSQFIRREAFALPALGTYGNMKFSSVGGFAVWHFDMAMSRIFDVVADHRVEFPSKH